jgi:hypothetical protein
MMIGNRAVEGIEGNRGGSLTITGAAVIQDSLKSTIGAQGVFQSIFGRDLGCQARNVELEQLGQLGRPLQEAHEGKQQRLHGQRDAQDGLPTIVRREGGGDRYHERQV